MTGFSISGAALTALKNQLKQLDDGVYIPTIVWSEDTNGESAWEVGYHKAADVPQQFVVNIDALDVVVEPQWREALDGKTLDFVDGYFRVS